jgi:hypothetical protein
MLNLIFPCVQLSSDLPEKLHCQSGKATLQSQPNATDDLEQFRRSLFPIALLAVDSSSFLEPPDVF